MRLATIIYFVSVMLLLIAGYVWGADNSITVDQIGDSNNILVRQEGTGHSATVNLGANSNVDLTTLSILQRGSAKSAEVEVKSGIINAVGINQDGMGNHKAAIQNLTGNANDINITQTGAGRHEFNVIGGTGASTSSTTVSGNQSGNVGADKWFTVNLNGSTGAVVNVTQDNATTADQASMNVQCLSGTCGTYSYIKH